MKKFLATLLAITLTFGSVALPAAESGVIARGVNISASAEEYGDFEYFILDDGNVVISSYKGNSKKIVIPSTINGKKVTCIGARAFGGNYNQDTKEYESNITSITIPNGVTSIEYAAFQGCSSLTSINIPNSVTSIGDMAFECCTSLTSITIPNSVKKIDVGAFNNCSSLTSIVIPNGMYPPNNIPPLNKRFPSCGSRITHVALQIFCTDIFHGISSSRISGLVRNSMLGRTVSNNSKYLKTSSPFAFAVSTML